MGMLKGKLKFSQRRARRKKQAVAVERVSEGTRLTFRAELMPGREALDRTFTVGRVLANGRVELVGIGGQHAITEFEAVT